jgi:microsomal epoxide hydrolase
MSLYSKNGSSQQPGTPGEEIPYGRLPSGTTIPISHYKAFMPEDKLQELVALIRTSKIGPETYENSHGGEAFGLSRSWLASAKSVWSSYDWRTAEKHINSFPNFVASIDLEGDTYDVHFVGLFSKKEDARPVLLLHGWPGRDLARTTKSPAD